MKLEEAAKLGNEAVVGMCANLLDEFKPGKTYECAVGSAATTVLVHVFRLAVPRGKEAAREMLETILLDVALNIKKLNDVDFQFKVEAR
jgi:hypothetical protein